MKAIFAQQKKFDFRKFETISYLCLFGVLKLGSNSRHPTTSKMVSSANISSKSAFLFNKKIFLKISYRWCNPSVFSRSSHIWNRLSNFLMYPIIGKENKDFKSMNLVLIYHRSPKVIAMFKHILWMIQRSSSRVKFLTSSASKLQSYVGL